VLLTVDLARLELRPGDLVLDAGCGEGRHCFGALERGARVVGLDLDRDSLDRGSGPLRARAKELGSFGVMLHGNAFRLPFRDETFDRVICSEVMEHVHDWRGAARELARVVRPEGKVAITIPTATWLAVSSTWSAIRSTKSGTWKRKRSSSLLISSRNRSAIPARRSGPNSKGMAGSGA